MKKNEIKKLVKEWFKERSQAYTENQILVVEITDVKFENEVLVYVVAHNSQFPTTSLVRFDLWIDTEYERINTHTKYCLVTAK